MSTFQITQDMVDQGIFSGAGTLYVGGKVHGLVPKPANIHTSRYDLVSVCGMGMMRDRLFKSELPASVTCRSCEPKCEQIVREVPLELDVPGGDMQNVPQEPELPEEPEGWRERYEVLLLERDQLAERLNAYVFEAERYRQSLAEGVADWRTKRGNMGSKIRTLEGKIEELEIQLAAAQGQVRRPPARVADLKEQLATARKTLGLWKGLAGTLLWQYGGAGAQEKKVRLEPAVWAVSVAQVITVSMVPQDDGSVEVTATLKVPEGPQAVSE